MPLNALNLMYCKVHLAQIIIIEDIDNIIKGALEVFLSVLLHQKGCISIYNILLGFIRYAVLYLEIVHP